MSDADYSFWLRRTEESNKNRILTLNCLRLRALVGQVPGLVPGCFLVADRIPRGSIFHKAVVLIVNHDRHGSFGVIINNRS